jgi:hypothetical protein
MTNVGLESVQCQNHLSLLFEAFPQALLIGKAERTSSSYRWSKWVTVRSAIGTPRSRRVGCISGTL